MTQPEKDEMNKAEESVEGRYAEVARQGKKAVRRATTAALDSIEHSNAITDTVSEILERLTAGNERNAKTSE
jgi:hypothetical protein